MGTGNRAAGTGNRERGTGNRRLSLTDCHPLIGRHLDLRARPTVRPLDDERVHHLDGAKTKEQRVVHARLEAA